MRHPQIGVDHLLIVAHLVGGAVADLAAVIHHDHAVGQVHNHAHVMFDQRNRRAEFVVHIQDKAAHVLFLLDIHAGHGFIQQQKFGFGGQRTRQFHPLFQPVRQTAHGGLADRLNFQKVDDLFHDFAVGDLFSLSAAFPDRLRQQTGFHMRQPAGHDVVEHAHPLKQRDVLERARDAKAGNLIGFHRLALFAAKPDLAVLGMIEPRDHVQHRRFARAIRPDDRPDLAFADIKRNVLDRLHPAEPQGDAAHVHQHATDLATIRGHIGCNTVHHSAATLCCSAATRASQITSVAVILPLRPSS